MSVMRMFASASMQAARGLIAGLIDDLDMAEPEFGQSPLQRSHGKTGDIGYCLYSRRPFRIQQRPG